MHSALLVSKIVSLTSHSITIGQASVMVFSPHQDDETLGCGGMIALKRMRNVPVSVVFLTDGQSGIGDPTMSREEIVQLRKREAIAALDILGVAASDLYFLAQPDGSLSNLPEQQRQQTIQQLVQLLNACQPQEVYVPHRHDRHADHEATYDLVQAAVAEAGIQVTVYQYPIWMLWKAPLLLDLKLSEILGADRLSIQLVAEQKQAAITAYDSQCNVLPPGFLKRFISPYEFFWSKKAFRHSFR